jgi:hypothetical protein
MKSEYGMTSSGADDGAAGSGCALVAAGWDAGSAGTSSSLISNQPTVVTTELPAWE